MPQLQFPTNIRAKVLANSRERERKEIREKRVRGERGVEESAHAHAQEKERDTVTRTKTRKKKERDTVTRTALGWSCMKSSNCFISSSVKRQASKSASISCRCIPRLPPPTQTRTIHRSETQQKDVRVRIKGQPPPLSSAFASIRFCRPLNAGHLAPACSSDKS